MSRVPISKRKQNTAFTLYAVEIFKLLRMATDAGISSSKMAGIIINEAWTAYQARNTTMASLQADPAYVPLLTDAEIERQIAMEKDGAAGDMV